MAFKYRVLPGETPTQIAKKFQVNPQDLLQANPGTYSYSTGQTVKVPTPPQPSSASSGSAVPNPVQRTGPTGAAAPSRTFDVGQSISNWWKGLTSDPNKVPRQYQLYVQAAQGKLVPSATGTNVFAPPAASSTTLSGWQQQQQQRYAYAVSKLQAGQYPSYVSTGDAQALGIAQDLINAGYEIHGAVLVAPSNLANINAQAQSQNVGGMTNPTYGLAQGERIKTDWGGTIIGGTPTASGQEQYAQINPVQGDKWKVITVQDKNGNWVRKTTYDYNRGGRAQRRNAELAQTQQQASDLGTVGLVNFRASAG